MHLLFALIKLVFSRGRGAAAWREHSHQVGVPHLEEGVEVRHQAGLVLAGVVRQHLDAHIGAPPPAPVHVTGGPRA